MNSLDWVLPKLLLKLVLPSFLARKTSFQTKLLAVFPPSVRVLIGIHNLFSE